MFLAPVYVGVHASVYGADHEGLARARAAGRARPTPGDAGLLRSLGRLGSLGALRPVSHTWIVVRGARAA